jgi:aminoglycoside phosphotransferase (APT) family kinase protein
MRFDARARDWLTRVLGPGHRVVDARRARGGVSSVVHRVRVVDRAGNAAAFMLRRVPPRDDATAEVSNEASVLRRFGGGPIPELVAADPHGQECGVAALLSTWLPGRPDVAPPDPYRWVGALASALDAVPDAPEPTFGAFVPWLERFTAPPPWSRVPDTWVEVRASLDSVAPPGGRPRFVHRDFHPANVLLRRGRFSGIVDWTNASIGPPEVDVSRARVEIAILTDLSVADAFLRTTPGAATYDPRWDALVACELAPCTDDLLQFNTIGARVTLEHIAETLDALVETGARHL